MIAIDRILVSDELLEEHFCCDLSQCRGACCVEGDFGAPLEEDEVQMLKDLQPLTAAWLSPDDAAWLKENGPLRHYDELEGPGTMLREDGSCVFSYRDPGGTVKCAIESAWKAGETDFQKPVSCQLYPVRASRDPHTGFEALNYDRWDICSGGCNHGEELKMPLFRFVKDGLLRKYGKAFYEALEFYHEKVAEGK